MVVRDLVILLLSAKICSTANILAVFMLPGASHFVMFGPVLRELANRGHNVDVVSHFPLKTPIERYNDISIRGSSPIFTNNMTIDTMRMQKGADLTELMTLRLGTKICQNSFKTPQLQKLKKSRKKYDLFITQIFGSDCMLGWAWHFGVPSVLMTSSTNLPWDADRFGLPDNPSYIPNYFVGYGTTMTLYERIINTWTLIKAKVLYRLYSYGTSNRLAKEFFGGDMPDLDILTYNSSLNLVNSHFSLMGARPLPPSVINVAGLHIREPKPLNEHFEKLLSTSIPGAIYLTMGSVVLTESLPVPTLQAMFDAFAEFPYRVLWKANKTNFPEGLSFPENIHFEPWMPQMDLLCDPRVKLFVSHGGMMGTQESVYCGVPILGLPVFADQKLNLKHAEAMGFAITVEYEDISKNTILEAAEKLLNDPSYSHNVKKTSEQFMDRPLPPLDTAVYWIEYVIRHKGAPRLQSAAKYLAWYQYYLLDVIAIVFGLPLVVLYFMMKALCRLNMKAKRKIKNE